MMIKVRFDLPKYYSRPAFWPIKYPYWVTGYHDFGVTIVAYVDSTNDIIAQWPAAWGQTIDEFEETDKITFSERFPRPDWYKDDMSHVVGIPKSKPPLECPKCGSARIGKFTCTGNFKSSFVGWNIVNHPDMYSEEEVSQFNNDRPINFKAFVCIACGTPFAKQRWQIWTEN